MFSFIGSLACKKLTGQIIKPVIIVLIVTRVIPWLHQKNSFREKYQFPGATKCLQRLEFYFLIKIILSKNTRETNYANS